MAFLLGHARAVLQNALLVRRIVLLAVGRRWYEAA